MPKKHKVFIKTLLIILDIICLCKSYTKLSYLATQALNTLCRMTEDFADFEQVVLQYEETQGIEDSSFI